MASIRKGLAALAEKLGLDQAQLDRARRRYKANRKRAFVAHNKQIKAQEAADKARQTYEFYGTSAEAKAKREDKAALRQGHVAHANHTRAQFCLGRIKVLTQRMEGLETKQSELVAKAKAYRNAHGIKVKANKVTGGTPRKRLLAAAHASAAACASGKRANFYSQTGAYDVDHCITGPAYGERDDCSSWETSCHKSAGLPDPNATRYTGGYTGTMTARGKQVSRAELKGGEAVLYGSYPYHHTEMVDDPARGTTIGHGSAPVDAGIIDLFGPNEEMTFWSYTK